MISGVVYRPRRRLLILLRFLPLRTIRSSDLTSLHLVRILAKPRRLCGSTMHWFTVALTRSTLWRVGETLMSAESPDSSSLHMDTSIVKTLMNYVVYKAI